MVATPPKTPPPETDARVLSAEDVSFEEYMERYAAHFYEWVGGKVVKMTPVSSTHDRLTAYLRYLLDAYLTRKPVGVLHSAPFVMRVRELNIAREPDLQIVLQEHRDRLTETATEGPADVCIEVVSAESVTRDYGQKFEEYEKAGVSEYWIIDPLRKQCTFYRLTEQNVYTLATPDANSFYRTPLLPDFALHVPTLWQDPLPDIFAVIDMVRAMLGENA